MKKLLKLLLVLVTLVVAAVGLLYAFQEKIIFLSEELPQEHNFTFKDSQSFEEIVLHTNDGAKLHGIHFKAEKTRGLVLYYHGNAGNLAKWGAIAPRFTKYGYDVLMMDYRGYGKSSGERSEAQLYEDAMAFFSKAKELVPEGKIIVYGRSLGTTFATYVASKNSPRKLILESPFYSLEKLAKNRYPYLPIEKLLKYKFETANYIVQVSCPITIIHGADDGIVPYKEAEQLYNVIPEQQRTLVTIKNGKHNNLGSFQEYWLTIHKMFSY
ncbi:alpha/beta hydrolase [Marinirhabdus gelatinilytica]|uniref:Serine aminopeptidase S33 domain-containing protein n=1 Tax=Marinirhabdus gelatinilytica TaxID=1703343 RepID=A0A370QBJ5_9FLAO|nr:alpha/beta fold hydrolase [Marinirhabdus gelatinilytica]RDK85380.1 hypothetical protein C8D94_103205 [Marinirhabdus gelatinilytica]